MTVVTLPPPAGMTVVTLPPPAGMTVVTLPPPRYGATLEEIDYLTGTLAKMGEEDREELVLLMRNIRNLGRRKSPLTVAFACLAVAEVSLLDCGIPLNEEEFQRLRGYVLVVADRMVAPP